MDVARKRAWFERLGCTDRPISIAGWVVTLISLGLCVRVFLAVDRRSHSVSDTRIGVFAHASLSLIIEGWIASNTCRSALRDGPGRVG